VWTPIGAHCLTRMLPDKLTARTGAGAPNRIGVADGGPISMGARREITVAVAARYRSAGRTEKGLVLDELCKLTGWHRQATLERLRCTAHNHSVGLGACAFTHELVNPLRSYSSVPGSLTCQAAWTTAHPAGAHGMTLSVCRELQRNDRHPKGDPRLPARRLVRATNLVARKSVAERSEGPVQGARRRLVGPSSHCASGPSSKPLRAGACPDPKGKPPKQTVWRRVGPLTRDKITMRRFMVFGLAAVVIGITGGWTFQPKMSVTPSSAVPVDIARANIFSPGAAFACLDLEARFRCT